jgi:hypothetical protein
MNSQSRLQIQFLVSWKSEDRFNNPIRVIVKRNIMIIELEESGENEN